MTKKVKYEIDLANLPPLTAAQKAELDALARRALVDCSDIPALPSASRFWKDAIRNPFYKSPPEK